MSSAAQKSAESSQAATLRKRDSERAAERGMKRVGGTAESLLELQQSAGNRAVTELLRGSSGKPLDRSTRREMEAKFGADFGDVRVHTGEDAARSAETLRAEAYTLGRDIVFGGGKYSPSGMAGRRLLAHELAHVVQQSRKTGARSSRAETSALEASADKAASGIGGAAGVEVGGASAVGIARSPADDDLLPMLPENGVEMPWVGKGPGIDSSELGFLRDPEKFWKEYATRHPSALSPDNLKAAQGGKAPTVDTAWLEAHPQHSAFEGDKLVHHHVGKGSKAVPIPEGLHETRYKGLHPTDRVPAPSGKVTAASELAGVPANELRPVNPETGEWHAPRPRPPADLTGPTPEALAARQNSERLLPNYRKQANAVVAPGKKPVAKPEVQDFEIREEATPQGESTRPQFADKVKANERRRLRRAARKEAAKKAAAEQAATEPTANEAPAGNTKPETATGAGEPPSAVSEATGETSLAKPEAAPVVHGETGTSPLAAPQPQPPAVVQPAESAVAAPTPSAARAETPMVAGAKTPAVVPAKPAGALPETPIAATPETPVSPAPTTEAVPVVPDSVTPPVTTPEGELVPGLGPATTEELAEGGGKLASMLGKAGKGAKIGGHVLGAAGAAYGFYEDYKDATEKKHESKSEAIAGATGSTIGGFSGGPGAIAANVANLGVHAVGNRLVEKAKREHPNDPAKVKEIQQRVEIAGGTTQTVTEVLPSSMIAQGLKAAGRSAVNLSKGDMKAMDKQAEGFERGEAGAPLMGWTMMTDLGASIAGGEDPEHALNRVAKMGENTPVAKAGDYLGDQAFQFINKDLPEAAEFAKKDIADLKQKGKDKVSAAWNWIKS